VGFTSIDEGPLKFVFHEVGSATLSTNFNLNLRTLTKGFSEVLTAFMKLAEFRLSDKQKQLLPLADEFLKHKEMSLNSLVEKISKELKMSFSTVKWNMNVLKKTGLIDGGRKNSKGLPARLTLGGKILVEYLRKNP